MPILSVCAGALEVNAYIIWDERSEEALLIDAPEAGPVLRMLGENGLKLKSILLTHGHFDHIQGLKELADVTGAEVAIHRLDAEMLTDPKENLGYYLGEDCACKRADRLLADGDEIEAGGIRLRVLHTPGHSRGSVCFVGDGAVFTGDTLFYLSVGRTDFPHSDARAMRESLSKLFMLDPSLKVYPGHGMASGIGFESENNPFRSAI